MRAEVAEGQPYALRSQPTAITDCLIMRQEGVNFEYMKAPFKASFENRCSGADTATRLTY
jgi:hypothetical protein